MEHQALLESTLVHAVYVVPAYVKGKTQLFHDSVTQPENNCRFHYIYDIFYSVFLEVEAVNNRRIENLSSSKTVKK